MHDQTHAEQHVQFHCGKVEQVDTYMGMLGESNSLHSSNASRAEVNVQRSGMRHTSSISMQY